MISNLWGPSQKRWPARGPASGRRPVGEPSASHRHADADLGITVRIVVVVGRVDAVRTRPAALVPGTAVAIARAGLATRRAAAAFVGAQPLGQADFVRFAVVEGSEGCRAHLSRGERDPAGGTIFAVRVAGARDELARVGGDARRPPRAIVRFAAVDDALAFAVDAYGEIAVAQLRTAAVGAERARIADPRGAGGQEQE